MQLNRLSLQELAQFRICRSLEHVGRRLLQPLYQIDFIWNRTRRAKRIREMNTFIRELITKVRHLSRDRIGFYPFLLISFRLYKKGWKPIVMEIRFWRDYYESHWKTPNSHWKMYMLKP